MKWMPLLCLFTTALVLVSLVRTMAASSPTDTPQKVRSFTMYPIGHVHKDNAGTSIEIEPKYQDALLGLEGFSHVWMLWWFDRNDNPQKRSVLRVHPRGNRTNPLTGVFATRSPARPNLIAMTLCKIRSIDNNIVRIERTDAFDKTPVVDLKPYIPGYDGNGKATVPSWINR